MCKGFHTIFIEKNLILQKSIFYDRCFILATAKTTNIYDMLYKTKGRITSGIIKVNITQKYNLV